MAFSFHGWLRYTGGKRSVATLITERLAVRDAFTSACVRQCAARMLGIAAKNRKVLTIWSIDGLAEKLDGLLTRNDEQAK